MEHFDIDAYSAKEMVQHVEKMGVYKATWIY
jgi:hypothetical protein